MELHCARTGRAYRACGGMGSAIIGGCAHVRFVPNAFLTETLGTFMGTCLEYARAFPGIYLGFYEAVEAAQ